MAGLPHLKIDTLNHLNDGASLPLMGFGTYLMNGSEAENAVTAALEAGYIHIDTAQFYENEKEVGTALKNFKAKNPDKKIFVTTKYNPTMHGEGPYMVYEAALESLKKLQVDQIDLFLLHTPNFGTVSALEDAWRQCIKLQNDKKVKSIGVSNFNLTHIQCLEKVKVNGRSVLPAANQFELHPFLTRKEIVEDHLERHIHVVAWGSLFRAKFLDKAYVDSLGDKFKKNWKVIEDMAKEKKKTECQLLLRWALDQGICVIPKSKNADRIKENADVFDFSLNKGEIEKLSSLNLDILTNPGFDPINRTVLD